MTIPFAIPAPLERTRLRLYVLQMLLDGGLLLAGFALAGGLYLGRPFAEPVWTAAQIALPLFWTVAVLNGTYSVRALVRPEFGIQRACLALLMAGLLVVLILFLVRSSIVLSRLGSASGFLVALGLIITSRYATIKLIRRRVGTRAVNLLLIDDGGPPLHLPGAYRIDAGLLGLVPKLDSPQLLDRLAKVIGPMDRVVVSCPPERRRAWAMVLKGSHMRGEIIDSELHDLGVLGTDRVDGVNTLVVASAPLGLRARLQKRLLDLSVALPVLFVLALPLLLIALAIRLEDGGPALFRQRRVGRNNRFFDIYKFRTMRVAQSDQAGARSVSRDDDRVTRIGRWLRRSSIDELPQLLNVVKGEMSLVGPRPHALASQAGSKLFWEVDERYWQRHALKPGISGLAQVRGLRGETIHADDLTQRLQADLEYQNTWSFWRDIVIIVRTFKVLFHHRAY